ncbi:MAG: ATP-binding cassette domain-containing protein [Gammaproteobacteria bacterium]
MNDHAQDAGAAPANAPPVLRVRDLRAGYGAREVLGGINFDIRPNEIFAIMGASGSGKTTLLRHLLGLSRPAAGSIELLGERVDDSDRETLYRLRRQIGVAFQHGALINSMSVIENVELPLRQHTRLDRATIRIMSRMKLEMMNLLGAEDHMPAQLSGGMLQRAGLARAVIMDPRVLFFDEPSAGLDPATADELDSLILGLRDAHNMTVVVVTHALESAARIADRIMILGDGCVRAIGTLAELRRIDDDYVRSLLERRTRQRELDGEAYLDRLTADIDA